MKNIYLYALIKNRLTKNVVPMPEPPIFFHDTKAKLQALDLHGPGKIRISQSGCLGRCAIGPCLVIYPEAVWYTYATNEDIDDIIAVHLIEGNRVHRLLLD